MNKNGPKGDKGPTETDVFVGSRIRIGRKARGMSQSQLAEQLGVSFQQLQKYEKGTNRISAGKLEIVAKVLGVPFSDFFPNRTSAVPVAGMAEEPIGFTMDRVLSAECVELLQAFETIKDKKIRRRLLELLRSLAEKGDDVAD